MKLIDIEIKGVTPLLQHRFGEDSEQSQSTRKVLISNGTPREQAEKGVYRAKDRSFFFPSTWITGVLREAGSGHKLRGSRRSAKFIVPSCVIVTEEAITLLNGDGAKAKDFEIDSRPVCIPSTKGRVMRHRPRFDQWSARFTLRINESVLPIDFIHSLLDEGGQQVGIGDFRPQKSGPFGCFLVTSWQERK